MRKPFFYVLAIVLLTGMTIARTARATQTAETYVSGTSCQPSNPHTDIVTYSLFGIMVSVSTPTPTVTIACALQATQTQEGSLEKVSAASYWSLASPTPGFDPNCWLNVMLVGGGSAFIHGIPLLGTDPSHPIIGFDWSGTAIPPGVLGSMTMSCMAVPPNASLNSTTMGMCYASSPGDCL